MRRGHVDQPVLITTARESSQDEYEHRRRKYALMMSIRGAAVVAAAACYQVSIWISLACLVAGAVLPWCAVLIANDGPPKSRRPTRQIVVPGERAIAAARAGKVVDAEPDEAQPDPPQSDGAQSANAETANAETVADSGA